MVTISELARWLSGFERVAVVPHVNPDGDALGSSLALARMIKKLGKRARVASADSVPAMYGFLPDVEEVVAPDALPFEPDAVLYADVAALDRAGDRCVLSGRGLPMAVIDHHETNPGFCEMSVVDGAASATGVLVIRLLDELGLALDGKLAICLYTAIATDTGNFSFFNTTPESYRMAARLLEAGLDLNRVNRYLFRLRSVARTKLLGQALHNMELFKDGEVALTRVTAKMFAECGADHAQTEGIINFLVDMQGVRAALTAEERGESTVKFSLRSADNVDVSSVARAFGGGGHFNAAGMTILKPMDEAIDLALGALLRTLGE